MEMDQGKLFIGGISWDTNEDRLKEYFGKYGDVVEAVTMRDRNTGRARGFGFVVFSDPKVAERVVKEKHSIDGRAVEAKKAVPRDDQNLTNRNNSVSIQGSPGQGRTRKIFVGGLASTVTENDFKSYFEQFGTIKDVVVMYDPNTQRPRGFGFITFDSEDSVDRVLHKVFHELNGKMVEVKRAVPKELSPGPSRSPLIGYNSNHGLFGRPNNFLSNYAQGYNLDYGMRIDGRYSPLTNGRSGLSQFGPPTYGLGLNVDQGLNHGYGGGSSYGGYGRFLNPYVGGGDSPSRYNTPIGGNHADSFFDSSSSSPSRNAWGVNVSPNSSNADSYFSSGNGGGGLGVFGNNGVNWVASLGGNNNVDHYRGGEDSSYAMGGFARSSRSNGIAAVPPNGSYDKLYRGGSVYGDPTWQTLSSELENSFGFGIRRSSSEDGSAKESDGYGVGYDIANRQQLNRGIAS